MDEGKKRVSSAASTRPTTRESATLLRTYLLNNHEGSLSVNCFAPIIIDSESQPSSFRRTNKIVGWRPQPVELGDNLASQNVMAESPLDSTPSKKSGLIRSMDVTESRKNALTIRTLESELNVQRQTNLAYSTSSQCWYTRLENLLTLVTKKENTSNVEIVDLHEFDSLLEQVESKVTNLVSSGNEMVQEVARLKNQLKFSETIINVHRRILNDQLHHNSRTVNDLCLDEETRIQITNWDEIDESIPVNEYNNQKMKSFADDLMTN